MKTLPFHSQFLNSFQGFADQIFCFFLHRVKESFEIKHAWAVSSEVKVWKTLTKTTRAVNGQNLLQIRILLKILENERLNHFLDFMVHCFCDNFFQPSSRLAHMNPKKLNIQYFRLLWVPFAKSKLSDQADEVFDFKGHPLTFF